MNLLAIGIILTMSKRPGYLTIIVPLGMQLYRQAGNYDLCRQK